MNGGGWGGGVHQKSSRTRSSRAVGTSLGPFLAVSSDDVCPNLVLQGHLTLMRMPDSAIHFQWTVFLTWA